MSGSVLIIREFNNGGMWPQKMSGGGSYREASKVKDREREALEVFYTQKIESLLALLTKLLKFDGAEIPSIVASLRENYDQICNSLVIYIELKKRYSEIDEATQSLIKTLPILLRLEPIIKKLEGSSEMGKQDLMQLIQLLFSLFGTEGQISKSEKELFSRDVGEIISTLQCDPGTKSVLLGMSAAIISADGERVKLFQDFFKSFAQASDTQMLQMLQCAVELMKLGHYDEALVLFEETMSKVSLDPEITAAVLVDEAICLIRQGRHEEALKKLQAVDSISQEQKNMVSVSKLQCYELLNRMQDASEYYEEIRNAEFDEPQLILQQAKYMLYFENDKEAVAKKILPLSESDISKADLDADFLYLLSVTQYLNKNFEEGISLFKSALDDKNLTNSLFLSNGSLGSHIMELAIMDSRWSDVVGLLDNIQIFNKAIVLEMLRESIMNEQIGVINKILSSIVDEQRQEMADTALNMVCGMDNLGALKQVIGLLKTQGFNVAEMIVHINKMGSFPLATAATRATVYDGDFEVIKTLIQECGSLKISDTIHQKVKFYLHHGPDYLENEYVVLVAGGEASTSLINLET